MVSALLGIFTGLVGWLASHLPASPLQAVAIGGNGVGGFTVAQLLAYVNWLIPFGDMLLLLTAWLGAAVTFIAVKLIIKVLRMREEAAL